MAIIYEREIFSQNSIYNKSMNMNRNDRKPKVYFSVPQNGTNEENGLILFIVGFLGAC